MTATWTAKTTCRAGCGRLYESTPFNGPVHARNARIKATRIAQEHSAATGHDVEVADDALTSLVACRCARCGKATPGQASGLCAPCLWARVESRTCF
jgi:hypothetical protein